MKKSLSLTQLSKGDRRLGHLPHSPKMAQSCISARVLQEFIDPATSDWVITLGLGKLVLLAWG